MKSRPRPKPSLLLGSCWLYSNCSHKQEGAQKMHVYNMEPSVTVNLISLTSASLFAGHSPTAAADGYGLVGPIPFSFRLTLEHYALLLTWSNSLSTSQQHETTHYTDLSSAADHHYVSPLVFSVRLSLSTD